ncbi:MAG: hypothetical protein AAFO29_08495, partial [Actinomycetota bacterium]
ADDPARFGRDAVAFRDASAEVVSDMAIGVYDTVVDTTDAVVTAVETGDGYAIGRGMAHAGAFAAEAAVGVGLVGRAARAGSFIRRSQEVVEDSPLLLEGPKKPGGSDRIGGSGGNGGPGGGDGDGGPIGPQGSGPESPRFLVAKDGTTVDVDYLRSLREVDQLPGSRNGKLPNGGVGEPYTFAKAGEGHVVVYGRDGRAMADISAKRIKAIEWNEANGQLFMKKGNDTKAARDSVPQEVLRALGLE